MGAYDSVYARCNCDWPDDDRCKNLPDHETRWFNHLLWLESVRQKSSVLPARFDAAHWSRRLHVGEDRVVEMIKAMASEELIGWTASGELVVFGTKRNHPKLAWVDEEPTEILNPFKKSLGWNFLGVSGESSGYPVKSPVKKRNPVKSPTVSKSIEEKSIEEQSKVPAGDTDSFPTFYAAYPRKESKADALKAWKQVDGDKHLGAIQAALSWQVAEWAQRDSKFIPLPATYLRGKRWEDEKPPAKLPQSGVYVGDFDGFEDGDAQEVAA